MVKNDAYRAYLRTYELAWTTSRQLGIVWPYECMDGDEWNRLDSTKRGKIVMHMEALRIKYQTRLRVRSIDKKYRSQDIPTGSWEDAW